jgi:deoxyribodipyrimidine photo-lyase
MPQPTVFWFRRDLRLADHPALAAAAADGPVVGLFVFDDGLWNPAGANRLAFLIDSLTALDQAMGERLVFRSGDPAHCLIELCQQVGASRVLATADHGPYGRLRDEKVGAALDQAGFEARFVDSNYAVAPGTILSGGGTPYKVFTPFFKAWKAHGWPRPGGPVDVDWVDDIDRGTIAEAPAPTADELPRAGEAAAWHRAEWFLDNVVDHYDEYRDRPGIDGTSRLSPYLKWGVIHPRQLLDRLGPSAGAETFRSEICWREFYADVLTARPETARHAFAEKMAGMEVDDGPDADARFDAWAEGRTGYPIVDAGMRQLRAEGWMHNRVRMIVASFLVKDLHLDWTRGARHFMRHLADGDLASNSHGWQWVAGTGTDASPYFRIFNPVSQSKKFDPDGFYLRRWVPELADLEDRWLHEPWAASSPPLGYPQPIVDHGVERKESLARYESLKQRW